MVFTHCAAPSSACQSYHSQPVSTKTLLEVQRLITTRICAPQVGQKAASGCVRTIGESDGAVLERDDAAIGDSDPEDIGGEVCEGGVSVVIGLTVDVPGGVPDLWVDVLQQSGCAHLLFPNGAVDGGEGFHGDKE